MRYGGSPIMTLASEPSKAHARAGLRASRPRARLPRSRARSPRPRRRRLADTLERGGEHPLQAPEGVEVRVHAHECLDQTLHLLGDPADLLPADGLEGPAEALVQGEQIRDVPHAAALAEPAHQLAVVAHQLLGLATDVGRHAPSACTARIDARRLGGLHPPPPVRQQENERAAAARPEPVAPFDALRVEQFVELQHDLLLVSGDPATLPERLVQRTALFLGVAGPAGGVLQDGPYTILATYGLGSEDRARDA